MTQLVIPSKPVPEWLDTRQYPFHSKHFPHTDGTMRCVDTGRGSPLLFVHGTPSWSFEWRAAIAHFEDRYRCIAPDHLGFGLSEKPTTAGYLPSDHTRRLRDLLRAFELEDVTLVVHDFGGPIALPLLVTDASRFRRVVIVNSWGWAMDDHAKGRSLMRFIRSPLGRFLYLSCNASPRWLLPTAFAKRSRLSPQVHRHYKAPFPNRAARLAPWTLGANLVESSAFAPELPAVVAALAGLPTALIWGKLDPLVDQTVLERWQQLLPHAPTYELADSGHFPQEESPREFIAALEAALTSRPQSSVQLNRARQA